MKMMPQALIYRIIGHPVEEAKNLCDEGEIELHILSEGEESGKGENFKIDRLNVCVKDGKVTKAIVG